MTRTQKRRYRSQRRVRWHRPSVESLEVRTLLAAFVVNTPLDSVDVNPGDGVAEDAQGFTSLRAAVMEANALAGDDVIQLAPGSSTLVLAGADSDATHDLDIRSNITIEATGSHPTQIVGTAGGRIFHVHPGASLTLLGVQVTGGDTMEPGGGIFNDGGTLQLVNTTVSGNSATMGGGIANTGSVSITSSTISGNSGGGIRNESGASLAISQSTISNNTAPAAAGIENLGTALLSNTIVAGNIGTTTNTDVAGTFTSAGYNLIGNVGDGTGSSGFVAADFVGTGAAPIDPRLHALADNGATSFTHALLPGSVAIDGGKNNLADSSGNNNTATIIGGVTSVAGQLGLAADFPGGTGDVADDYLSIDVANIAAADIPTNAITIATWGNVTQTGFTQAIFASRTGDGDFIIHAEVRDDGQVRFTLRDDNGDTIIDFVGGSVPFDQWFHYAATYDQGTNQVAVYINGTAIFNGPATLNNAIGSDWDDAARIGSTTSNARPFQGQMDEFYVFTRALDSTEIATLATVPPLPTGSPQVTGDLSIYYSFDDISVSILDQRGGPRVLDGDGLGGATIDIGAFERVNDFDPNNPIPEEIQTGDITVRISPIAIGLVSPSQVFNAGDGSGRLYITDQFGFVFLIKDGDLQETPFLDLTPLIRDTLNGNDERGLSGFAFHPDFAVTGAAGYGKFYTWVDELVNVNEPVDFTHFPLEPGVERAAQSVLREWSMIDITADVFSGSSREVMRVDQPHQAHSAGSAAFGPDGYLYLALGDGGTHDDQGPGHNPITGNARDLTNVYGSILRIDPMGTNSANGKYGVPATNPFVGDEDALDEIFFYGLRNPFRFSFELDEFGNKTTKIVIGDAGQDDIEEVDRADIITDAGGNFGWNIKEGTFLFDAGPPPSPGGELRIGVTADSPGSPLGLIDPVLQYDHGPNGEGTAVIGGYLYQGDLIPELKGKYVFGDFNEKFSGPTVPNGRIFYADLEAENPEIFELNLEGAMLSGGGGLAMFIKGFGIDEMGEMYVVGSRTLASGDNSGVIIKLRPATGVLPAVVVSPTLGLTTSEDGDTAEIDVVLTTPPTHSVSFTVISENEGEGVVSTDSVTFSPANWNITQTIVVTGVDDNDVDGPVQYRVRLGTVTSGDLEYAGLGPESLLIANLDNEVDPAEFIVEIGAALDNTLYESVTGALSNGAGQYLFTGATANGQLRRGLLAFDLAGAIPADATITDVSLQLNMSMTIASTTGVSLHLVLAEWGEGSSDASGPEGAGAAAETGDATWLHTSSDSTLWATPGGDFRANASATTAVAGNGTYAWSSTQLIADVRRWIAFPSMNAGWIVIGDESQPTTAKRFDSRENPTAENRPVLRISYSTPPLVADGNLDGRVDGLDYLVWVKHFGDNPPQDPPGSPLNGDFFPDGVVDEFDYLVWVANYGNSKPSLDEAGVAGQPASLTSEDLDAVDIAVVDIAIEDDYDTGAAAADELGVRQWQLSRAYDSVLGKIRSNRQAKGK